MSLISNCYTDWIDIFQEEFLQVWKSHPKQLRRAAMMIYAIQNEFTKIQQMINEQMNHIQTQLKSHKDMQSSNSDNHIQDLNLNIQEVQLDFYQFCDNNTLSLEESSKLQDVIQNKNDTVKRKIKKVKKKAAKIKLSKLLDLPEVPKTSDCINDEELLRFITFNDIGSCEMLLGDDNDIIKEDALLCDATLKSESGFEKESAVVISKPNISKEDEIKIIQMKPMEIVQGHRSDCAVYIDIRGFCYTRDHLRDGLSYYKCIDPNCLGRAIGKKGGNLIEAREPHNHAVDPMAAPVLRFKQRLRERAIHEDTCLYTIYMEERAKDIKVAMAVGNFKGKVERFMQRARNAVVPASKAKKPRKACFAKCTEDTTIH